MKDVSKILNDNTQRLLAGVNSDCRKKLKSAIDFASVAHDGQYRQSNKKMERAPYVLHPIGVALRVLNYFDKERNLTNSLETLLCVSLLHDVLEDSFVNEFELEDKFGIPVGKLVNVLTKKSSKGWLSMEEYIAQINLSGRDAVFVKACDVSHNLSRPQTTPTNLLNQTISRVKNVYIPLFEKFGLISGILDEVKTNLKLSEVEIGSRKEEDSNIENDEKLVEESLRLSDEKIVEINDIVELFLRCKGVVDVGVLNNNKNSVSNEDSYDEFQWFKSSDKHKIIEMDCKPIFLLGFGRGRTRNSMAVIIKKNGPEWWSLDLVYRYLLSWVDLEKSIRRESQVRRIENRFTAGAKSLKEKDVITEKLGGLEKLYDKANIVFEEGILISDEILSFCDSVGIKADLEKRIKSLTSSSRKLGELTSAGKNIEEMTDLVGFRFVVPTKDDVVAVFEKAQQTIVEHNKAKLVEVRRHDGEPTRDGYRGINCICEVEVENQKIKFEIQIQTIMQRAWTKLSHRVSYKTNTGENKNLRRIMRDFSVDIDEFESKI